MTITLESIESEHQRLGDLIDQFRREQAEKSVLYMPEATIALRPGELYAGIMLDDEGKPSYHLILLPGDVADINWTNATSWAVEQGGELPKRREQSLLFANLKQHFEKSYYWSSEAYESDNAYAWCQTFSLGYQDGYRKDYYYCRARAVRRLEIQ